MGTVTPRKTPITCPACSRAVRSRDIKAGRCPACNTKICIPKTYYRSSKLLSLIVTILFIVETFSTFFTSPASFPLVMLWLLMIFAVNIASILLINFVSYRMFPPVVKSLHANDDIAVLRLDE
jgi:hypothetical protein